MRTALCFLALGILVVRPAWSQAETSSALLPQARTAFERQVPGRRFHAESTTFGDLNADGILDFATFVGDPERKEHGVEDLKIAVFLGTPDGGFRFHDMSSKILGHGRVSHGLAIEHQSLYLHRDGSGGCCSHWVERFQFKIHKGRLALIGVENAIHHTNSDDAADAGISANLVTGRVIKWTGKGKTRREVIRKVPNLMPLPLKSFEYEAFSDQWAGVLW